ncbi:MAG: zinc metallopeptidase [Planctomycetota bacterium]
MFFDFRYILFVMIPALVLAGLAQMWLKGAFAKWSQRPARSGMSGREAARAILDAAGLHDVRIEGVPGMLSDHYDPNKKAVFLSQDIMDGRTPAAIGVAAHEVGHALQDAQGYAPMRARAAIVPLANIGSQLAFPMIILGLILNVIGLAWVGVVAFGLAVLFHLVTLPVEFDASRRAIKIVDQSGIAHAEDMPGVRSCLHAAGFTYVAATAGAILNLLYYVMLVSSASRD